MIRAVDQRSHAMRLGWTILHVPDVGAAVGFYERAFGLARRFVDPSGEYAEMETGATALAFSSHALVARLGFEDPGHARPHGTEIALVTDEDRVAEAYERAVGAGAEVVARPERRPWGQVVGFVRDPNGFLVEICSPVPPSQPSGGG